MNISKYIYIYNINVFIRHIFRIVRLSCTVLLNIKQTMRLKTVVHLADND